MKISYAVWEIVFGTLFLQSYHTHRKIKFSENSESQRVFVTQFSFFQSDISLSFSLIITNEISGFEIYFIFSLGSLNANENNDSIECPLSNRIENSTKNIASFDTNTVFSITSRN